MLIRLSQLPVFSCFMQGKKERKKVDDGKVLTINGKGRSSTRAVKRDPEVEQISCSLRYLGAGQRRHPETIIQIGDGNLLKRRK
jgi:hypothetical protein